MTDTWGLGRYVAIAERLRPAAHALVDAVGAREGLHVLDLAAGQGNCALEAARRGARVTAVDASPAMVATGRAATGDLPVEWVEADARTLPLGDAEAAAAVSSFGLIFVPEPGAAVAELARVLRPGAPLAVATWVPDGPVSATARVFADRFGPPPHDVYQWGREERVHDLLDGGFTDVRVEIRPLPWPAASPEDAVAWMAANSPQHVAGFAALGAAAGDVRREMAAVIAEQLDGADARSMVLPWYLVTARRR